MDRALKPHIYHRSDGDDGDRRDPRKHSTSGLSHGQEHDGGRLHTARSRNDQVATDFRLWVREACRRASEQVLQLMRALLDRADAHVETIMPGFTHMQPAQPVTFGHHCLAYVEMLARDQG